MSVEHMAASLAHASEAELFQQPVHPTWIDRREARQLRHLDLLRPHELREPVAQIRVLLETESQDFLQICPQLVKARRLRMRTGYARHDANKEPGFFIELDVGGQRGHRGRPFRQLTPALGKVPAQPARWMARIAEERTVDI